MKPEKMELRIKEAQKMVAHSESIIEILGKCEKVIKNIKNSPSLRKELIGQFLKNADSQTRSRPWNLVEKVERAEASIAKCPEIIKLLSKVNTLLKDEEYMQRVKYPYINLMRNIALNEQKSFVTESFQKHVLDCLANINDMSAIADDLYSILDTINLLPNFYEELTLLEALQPLSEIDRSVVIVGANGSGKSSFANYAKIVLGDSIVFIPAQKIFAYEPISSVSITDRGALHKLQRTQRHDEFRSHGNDLPDVVSALVEDYIYHHFASGKAFEELRHLEESERPKVKPDSTKFAMVMGIWQEFIAHRSMTFYPPNIVVSHNKGGGDYDFTELSDGEKAIFYYIAKILLAQDDSYIVVDEPENHLHASIVSKLWDRLESLREDCKFVYLTHDLNFASSRKRAAKLWNKSFMPSGKWDVRPLPADEDLPEALLMELLGSRKKILFCEGEVSSLDYELYKLLFPNYTIKPVVGHIDVINYTRAFNKLKEKFENSAIGIIDGDFHSPEEKTSWQKDSIYCVDAQEVENVLCDEKLLEAAKQRFCSPQNAVKEAKKELFKELRRHKKEQAVRYAAQKVNSKLKSNLIKKPKTGEELKNQLASIAEIDVAEIVRQQVLHFDGIIGKKDYDSGVRSYNNKGLTEIVGKKIVSGYKKRMLQHLESADGAPLLKHLREKYYPNVPTD